MKRLKELIGHENFWPSVAASLMIVVETLVFVWKSGSMTGQGAALMVLAYILVSILLTFVAFFMTQAFMEEDHGCGP